jgi:hypothetical protein
MNNEQTARAPGPRSALHRRTSGLAATLKELLLPFSRPRLQHGGMCCVVQCGVDARNDSQWTRRPSTSERSCDDGDNCEERWPCSYGIRVADLARVAMTSG